MHVRTRQNQRVETPTERENWTTNAQNKPQNYSLLRVLPAVHSIRWRRGRVSIHYTSHQCHMQEIRFFTRFYVFVEHSAMLRLPTLVASMCPFFAKWFARLQHHLLHSPFGIWTRHKNTVESLSALFLIQCKICRHFSSPRQFTSHPPVRLVLMVVPSRCFLWCKGIHYTMEASKRIELHTFD